MNEGLINNAFHWLENVPAGTSQKADEIRVSYIGIINTWIHHLKSFKTIDYCQQEAQRLQARLNEVK